ncbi:hypothetical protein ABID26_007365 [Mesorhizobium shonense]|uniref:Transposase n=1 Tax=Mesorhizobium shonense TaxID=1209948 RepID=A0ABV2I4Y6_9HYPH
MRERVTAYPDLSAARLTREIRERGSDGAYTAEKRFVAAIRQPEQVRPFEVRFETRPDVKHRSTSRASSPSSPTRRA